MAPPLLAQVGLEQGVQLPVAGSGQVEVVVGELAAARPAVVA